MKRWEVSAVIAVEAETEGEAIRFVAELLEGQEWDENGLLYIALNGEEAVEIENDDED